MNRRHLLQFAPAVAALLVAGCARSRIGPPAAGASADSDVDVLALGALADRLPASGIVLLGEVHDNEKGHAARLVVLQRLAAQPVPTVLALEHIDRSRQGALDTARAAAPRDAQRWIDAVLQAGNSSQWPWQLLRPALALAAGADWPVRGANLTRTELQAMPEAPASVLGETALQRLRDAIETGHCGSLPPAAVGRLVEQQQARDRAMVDTVRAARAGAARVILLAGNGHVRRDFGVGAYPQLRASGALVSIGFVERGNRGPDDAFDHVVEVAPQPRADPCAALRERKSG